MIEPTASVSIRRQCELLAVSRSGRFGTLSFYDCSGIRLLLDQAPEPTEISAGSPLYFRVADIALARRALEERGVVFIDQTQLIAPMVSVS